MKTKKTQKVAAEGKSAEQQKHEEQMPTCAVQKHEAPSAAETDQEHEPTALTEEEAKRLADYEAVIKKGLKHYLLVGEALWNIAEGRLYRSKYDTFEAYCEEEWEITRQHAYRLQDAFEVVREMRVEIEKQEAEQVSPIGDIPDPENEAQARQLTDLDPAKAIRVMRRAKQKAGGGRLTTTYIRQAKAEETDGEDGSEGVNGSASVEVELAGLDEAQEDQEDRELVSEEKELEQPAPKAVSLNQILDWVLEARELLGEDAQDDVVDLLDDIERNLRQYVSDAEAKEAA